MTNNERDHGGDVPYDTSELKHVELAVCRLMHIINIPSVIINQNQKVLAKNYFLFYILSFPHLPKHILFSIHIV